MMWMMVSGESVEGELTHCDCSIADRGKNREGAICDNGACYSQSTVSSRRVAPVPRQDAIRGWGNGVRM